MSDNARDEAAGWIAKAEQHLTSARILRDARGPSATACFLCQQAAETALKALIVAAGDAPPHTHDLVLLCEAIPTAARPAAAPMPDLARWSEYAVAPRYPGFGDDRADAELPALVAAVERLVAEVRARIGHGG